MKIDWYSDFVREVAEMEATMVCPKCKSENIYHVDPFGYRFMCGSCGHKWTTRKGKYKKHLKALLEENKKD